MTKRAITNQAASIHQRLLNLAKGSGRPFNELLQYYAIERFLYRLSLSKFQNQFVLKGALTMLVWQTPVTRPTRDIDLLGRVSNDLEAVRAVIAEVCQRVVGDDGLIFEPSSVATERIAEDADYQGVRVRFQGRLGNARIPMQIDIGFSDVITPAPVPITYPAMLGHPAAELMAYNRETTIAEKLEAMLSMGQLNSRMKDFFDVWLLAKHFDFDGRVLAAAVSHTFSRRQTPIVSDPVCFTADFANDPTKATQWSAFTRTLKLTAAPAFPDIIVFIQAFLEPVLAANAMKKEFSMLWKDSGPWHPI